MKVRIIITPFYGYSIGDFYLLFYQVMTERHGLDVWQRAATAVTLTYQRGYAPEHGFAPAEIGRTRLEQRP